LHGYQNKGLAQKAFCNVIKTKHIENIETLKVELAARQ
jgi:hypothetical protein